MGLAIDWTEYDKLTAREEYDAIGTLIDEVKALVAARRAEIAHDLAATLTAAGAAEVLGISDKRVYQLAARHRQTQETTVYLDWANANDGSARRYDEYLREVLEATGEDPDAYDLEAIGDDYADAIREALPEGVAFTRASFIGPYPAPEGVREVIRAAVASVDLWAIVAAHAPTESTD